MSLLHLAIAQFRPRKGDVSGNIRRIGEVLAQASALDPRPQVVQFPESALSGYFVEGGVRELSLTTAEVAERVAEAYRAAAPNANPIDVVLGYYERSEGTLYNSIAYLRCDPASDGAAEVLHVHRKNFLPTYGMFDEERFVERGYGVRAFDTPWGRAAMLVCEDAWHSLTGLIAALDGAQLVFVSAAAPARGAFERVEGDTVPATVARWDRLIRDIAEEQGVYVTLANLVGSEGGKMFQGSSCVMGPRGDTRARAPVWEEALLTASVDLDDIARARADAPMLSDVRTALPTLRAELDRAFEGARAKPDAPPATAKSASKPRTVSAPTGVTPAPLVLVAGGDRSRGTPPPLLIHAPMLEEWLLAFQTVKGCYGFVVRPHDADTFIARLRELAQRSA